MDAQDNNPFGELELTAETGWTSSAAATSVLYAISSIAWCCAIVAICALPAAVIGAWRVLL